MDRWNKAGHREIRNTELGRKSTKSRIMEGGVSVAAKTFFGKEKIHVAYCCVLVTTNAIGTFMVLIVSVSVSENKCR